MNSKFKIGQRLGGAAVAASVALMMPTVGKAGASPVDGDWAIQDLILEIYSCQNSFCGRVAWVKDPHRRQLDCGRTIVWGLTPSGPEQWDGGSIYDTTDGNTYRLKATLDADGTLHARIYRGIPMLGKTEVLRKVASRSQSGWC
jgi:uncharacterized protein (DUF2147 family)